MFCRSAFWEKAHVFPSYHPDLFLLLNSLKDAAVFNHNLCLGVGFLADLWRTLSCGDGSVFLGVMVQDTPTCSQPPSCCFSVVFVRLGLLSQRFRPTHSTNSSLRIVLFLSENRGWHLPAWLSVNTLHLIRPSLVFGLDCDLYDFFFSGEKVSRIFFLV